MSETMKAIQIQTTGDPSVLKTVTIPIPEIAPDQVLVKVHAAGLNPVDTYMREKKFGYDPSLPVVLGMEAAGEIVKVGNQAGNKFKNGDRVVCALGPPNYGGYAEYVACKVTDLIPLSSKLTYSQGAAIYVSYFTAYKALADCVKLKPREFLMVHGASGSVGTAAVQIAKAQNAVVAASAGSDKGLKLVKSMGADIVVDHREVGHLQRALSDAKRPEGFDVIFENRADLNLGSDLAALASKGRVVVVGSRGTVEVDPRNLIKTEGRVVGINLKKLTKDEFEEYAHAIGNGMDSWLKPVVDKEYSMSQIQEAHRDLVKSHGACGKLVLKIR